MLMQSHSDGSLELVSIRARQNSCPYRSGSDTKNLQTTVLPNMAR